MSNLQVLWTLAVSLSAVRCEVIRIQLSKVDPVAHNASQLREHVRSKYAVTEATPRKQPLNNYINVCDY
jgi:hypothetical protein